jgi:tRNA 2-selenouridine synthase
MRSSSVAWLAKTVGIDVQLLAGGYKSVRNWVLAQFELSWPICLLGGGTGSGKTAVLQALAKRGAAVVDLEKLANHRGSSFGGLGLPKQPSVEHFENCLAIELRGINGMAPLWLEAESAQVGRCRIPNGIWKQMQLAPLVVLERPKEERIAMLVEVYGTQCPMGLIEATERLSRKLGPQRTATALSSIRNGDLSRACAEILDYYDRSYTSELARRQSSIERLDGGGKSIENIAQLLMELRAA